MIDNELLANLSLAVGIDETQSPLEVNGSLKIWEATYDLTQNFGRVVLEMNSGTVGERYLLKLGDGVIFDSGQNWITDGSAYTGDFDRFVIDFSEVSKRDFFSNHWTVTITAHLTIKEDISMHLGSLMMDHRRV